MLENIIKKSKSLGKNVLVTSFAAATVLSACDKPTNSLPCPPPEGSVPEVSFTYVPPVGSFKNLEGEVENVCPDDAKICTYIRVGGTWWMKPYWNNPLTRINSDGTFVVDITTGGIDSQANKINVYIVTNDFDPVYHTLPDLEDEKVLAMVSVDR
jgi:hypothetical protein